MSISRKEVEHIAKLARLDLNEDEKAKLEKDLSSILGFVEKLKEADTTKQRLDTSGFLVDKIARPDEQLEKDLEGKPAKLIASFPEKKDHWLKVKSVFDA